MTQDPYRLAAMLLKHSRRIVALTGAGISTPSGIADFRSPETGLWNRIDPMEAASLQGFLRDPTIFYDWFGETALQVFAAKPNPAHQALAELEKRGILRTVVTQNIDGLHQKAGSSHVLELHGNCRTATCLRCGEKTDAQSFLENLVREQQTPYCACGGLIKPDVVFFGESLPLDVLQEAGEEIALCDLLLVVGSSLTVTPAAELPWLAIRTKTPLILCNLTSTWADRFASVLLQEDVAVSLPALLAG